jgi:hypothetical protein
VDVRQRWVAATDHHDQHQQLHHRSTSVRLGLRQRRLAAPRYGWHHHDKQLHHGFARPGLDLRQRRLAATNDDDQHLHHGQTGTGLDVRQRRLAAAWLLIVRSEEKRD